MNSGKKEQIFKAFLSLAAIGTSVAFAPAGPVLGVIKDLFKNLAPGWAAQFSVEALMPWVKRKWLTAPNPLINHHINNSLILSWKTTLDEVLHEYSEKKEGLYGQEAESLPMFIDMLKEISDDEFLKHLNEDLHQEEIFKYLSPDNAQIENYLNKRFDLDKKLNPFSEEYYLTQDFIEFFKVRVPALMSFYFRADLKKGKEAKQAVDLLYQETIREAVNVISTKQEEQLRILNELQGKVNKLTNIDDFEYTVLVTSIQNVQNEILQELTIIRENTIKIINLLNIKPSLSYNDESEEPNPGTLFSYKQKYTAFTGREKELNDLQNFIDDSRKFCWLTILGPGGIGKSRLALEITEIARTQKFHSGFLFNLKSFNWITWTPLIDTFIVIDYAYSNYQEVFDLIKLFREKGKQKELNFKIRLLLLDRDLREDWKINIKNIDEIRNSNFLKNSKEEFYVLQPLQNDQRWQIIQDIINKSDLTINEKKELLKSETEIINKLNIIDPKQRPLFAFFTGIAVVHEKGLQNIGNWNADDLIEHHLQRIEESVWKKIEGYKSNKDAIKKLLFINTLCRELSAPTVRIVSDKLNIDSNFLKNSYFLITENKRNDAGYVEKYYGMQPDILGEYFILLMVNEILEDPERDNKEWLDLYQYSIELDVKMVFQTFVLLNEDFKFSNSATLPDLSKEQIAEYDKLIQQSPDNYFYFSERGGLKYNCQEYESAIEDFNKSIEINPDNNISYYRRGLAKWKLNQFHQAIDDFEVSIKLYPDWTEPYNNKGFQLMKIGEIEKSIPYFTKSIFLNEKYIIAYQNRGNAYFESKKFEESIKDFSKAIELNSKDPDSYIRRANSKKALNLYQDAIEDYDQAITLEPHTAWYYSQRGIAKQNMHDYEEAIKDYDKAIELESNYADYFYNRAEAKKHLGKYQDAIEDYNQAITLDPNTAWYYSQRGIAKQKLHTYEEAIKDHDKAIELESNYADYFYKRAIAKEHLGKYQNAIEDYNIAIILDPNDDWYYSERGNINITLSRFDEAIKDYTNAIDLNSKDSFYFSQRGFAKLQINNCEEAITDYTKAIEIKPDDDALYYNRAYARDCLKMYESAIEDYDRAIKLNPHKAFSFSQRGNTKHKLHFYEEAITDHTIAIQIDPDTPDYYFNRGSAQSDLGNYQEAIVDYDKAVELDPNYFNYYFYRGFAKRKLNNYNAIYDYDKTIEINPTFDTAYLNRAIAKYLSNSCTYEEIISDSDKAIDLKKSSKNYYERALIKDRFKKYGEAIEDYNKAIELDPNNFNYYFDKGFAERKLNRYSEAIYNYDKALQINPTFDTAYLNRGIAKYFSDSCTYEEIISDLNKAIDLEKSSKNYYERALMKGYFKKYEEAIEDYNQALKIESNPDFFYNRGHVKFLVNKYEEAIIDFSKALEHEININYYNYRGYVLNAIAKYEDAINDFKFAIEIDPNFPDAYKHSAFAFYNLKQFGDALDNINKAIKL